MQQRHVFVAIPTLNGKLKRHTEAALTCAEIEASGLGWKMQRFYWSQDSIIEHARNVLVAKFRQTDCTDMLCVDSDVAWGPGVFTKLMLHNVDLVAGAYRTKNEIEKYMVRTFPDVLAHIDEATGLLEVETVPAGFLRLTRACVERMVDAHQDEWFFAANCADLKIHRLFAISLQGHSLVGEDFLFCKRWRAIGGKVWVDTTLPMHHIGRKGAMFTGTYGDFLRRHNAVPADQGHPPVLTVPTAKEAEVISLAREA